MSRFVSEFLSRKMLDLCLDFYLDLCLDFCLEKCLDLCLDFCLEKCLDLCLHFCLEKCLDCFQKISRFFSGNCRQNKSSHLSRQKQRFYIFLDNNSDIFIEKNLDICIVG